MTFYVRDPKLLVLAIREPEDRQWSILNWQWDENSPTQERHRLERALDQWRNTCFRSAFFRVDTYANIERLNNGQELQNSQSAIRTPGGSTDGHLQTGSARHESSEPF